MRKDRKIAIYRDMEADMTRLRRKYGDDLAAAVYVVLTSDMDMLIERGCPGIDDDDVSRKIAAVLAKAARLTHQDAAGIRGDSMGPTKVERKPGDGGSNDA